MLSTSSTDIAKCFGFRSLLGTNLTVQIAYQAGISATSSASSDQFYAEAIVSVNQNGKPEGNIVLILFPNRKHAQTSGTTKILLKISTLEYVPNLPEVCLDHV